MPSSFSFFLFEINTKVLTLTGVFRWNCFLEYWFSGQRMFYSQLINTIFLKSQCRFFQLGHYFSHILIILIQVRRNTGLEGVSLKQDFVVKGKKRDPKNGRIDFFAHLCITCMWMSIWVWLLFSKLIKIWLQTLFLLSCTLFAIWFGQ